MLKRSKYFLMGWVLVMIPGLWAVSSYSKEELHLKMNAYHSPWGDLFFKWLTFVGDGVFAAGISILLFFVRFRDALMVTTAWIAAGLTTQGLKRTVFADEMRPGGTEGLADVLHIPAGVELNTANSFPSGHSTTVFALCCSIALMSKNKTVQFTMLVLACIVAYSRVYLSQHFLQDILAGSLVGIVWALIAYYIWTSINKKWLDKSLVDFLK